MKKLLSSAVLALTVSAFVTAESFAGCCFGLCYRHCGCCGCGAKFCVRQYNAFSPVCSGSVFCDGCCPFGPGCGYGPGYGGGGPGAGGMCPGMMNYSGMMSCPGGGCGDGACLGSLPASEPASGVADAPGANPVVPPSPLPSGPVSQMVNDRPIQNAAYRPVNYIIPSTAAPAPMQPQMMAAPSYWGN